ncbi:MAG: putative lipopolysaccharide heptosyltransferase III [Pseudomonadales bacterium]|nr:putative lipopolysaccharide heptosyltransferase III [Pseudomonadales bacterium]
MGIDFSKLKRILIVKLRHHGDVLLISPLPSILRCHYPHLEVDVLVYADTSPLLENHPDISHIHVIDRRWRQEGLIRQLQGETHLLSTLNSRHYDLMLHLTESWRGAFLARWLRPRYAVTADYVRRRHSRWWRGSFSHHYAQPSRLRHTVEKHLDALRVLGLYPSPIERQLILKLTDESRQRVLAHLTPHGLQNRPFVVVHPTSRWLFKCWPTAHMAELINQLQERGWPVVLTAGPDREEMAMVAAILQGCTMPPSLNLAGQLSLPDLAALIAQARLFIGVDSAPMHMAAALNTPTVTLFGPSGDREWGPWMPPHRRRILTADPEQFPCRPCGLAGCADSRRSDCLEAIPGTSVLSAALELLS